MSIKSTSSKDGLTTTSKFEKPSVEQSNQKLKKYMKEEMQNVKGIFQDFESPGTASTITFKKYHGYFFTKNMQDGMEYEIPLYVARFLNGIDVTAEAVDGRINSCGYPVNSHIMDANGVPMVSPTKWKRRFGFQSLDFAGPRHSAEGK